MGILKWDECIFLTVLQPFAVHNAQGIFLPFEQVLYGKLITDSILV
jgi:hypothetical protein